MFTDRHVPWWAVNGLGMLVALLEITLGLSGIIIGPAGPIGWGYRIGILVGGVWLVFAYLSRRVRSEVYALVLIVVANLADLANTVVNTSPFNIPVMGVVVQAVILFGVSSRIWAMLVGGDFTIPTWHSR